MADQALFAHSRTASEAPVRRRPCVQGDKCYPGRSDDEDDLVIGDTIGKFWMNKEIGQAFKQFGHCAPECSHCALISTML